MTTSSTLAQIAAEMRAYAIDNPRLHSTININPYRRRLSKGLKIVLYLGRNHIWHLSLYRTATPPSPTEIAICRNVFNIPKDADQKTDDVHGWPIIRITWTEPGQMKLVPK
jgi:hypothetical protein